MVYHLGLSQGRPERPDKKPSPGQARTQLGGLRRAKLGPSPRPSSGQLEAKASSGQARAKEIAQAQTSCHYISGSASYPSMRFGTSSVFEAAPEVAPTPRIRPPESATAALAAGYRCPCPSCGLLQIRGPVRWLPVLLDMAAHRPFRPTFPALGGVSSRQPASVILW
jgi:hypothetical protein